MRHEAIQSLAGRFEGMRADYQAAKQGRFRRRRDGLMYAGSGGDFHYRNEADYFRVIEYARDMDRNDAIVGQMVDRAVMNTVQNGFQADPQTGDESVDADLFARFAAWAASPGECDAGGEFTFADMQEHVLRATLVDGDIFALPLDTGRLQLVEAHRCRTPGNVSGRWFSRILGALGVAPRLEPLRTGLVHGVLMDEFRARLAYYFAADDVDATYGMVSAGSVEEYPAFAPDGEPLVYHVCNPKRITQTRGVTAFAPVFDLMGMLEDINFAKLVQQQIVSCIAFIRKRPIDFKGGARGQTGPRTTDEMSDGASRLIEDIAPGFSVEGAPGEEITGFSPQVPNPEYFEQARLILQMIGVNLGLPLVMLLMDASDTNFSGWRGAVDQARMGFLRNQRWLKDRFHNKVWRWKLLSWASEDSALAAAAKQLGPAFFNVRWNSPRWPYIQPLQDAQADELRLKAGLTSPRRLHAERGQDSDEIVDERIADNERAIRGAIEASRRVASDLGVTVDPARFLYIDASQPIGGAAAASPVPTNPPQPETAGATT